MRFSILCLLFHNYSYILGEVAQRERVVWACFLLVPLSLTGAWVEKQTGQSILMIPEVMPCGSIEPCKYLHNWSNKFTISYSWIYLQTPYNIHKFLSSWTCLDNGICNIISHDWSIHDPLPFVVRHRWLRMMMQQGLERQALHMVSFHKPESTSFVPNFKITSVFVSNDHNQLKRWPKGTHEITSVHGSKCFIMKVNQILFELFMKIISGQKHIKSIWTTSNLI